MDEIRCVKCNSLLLKCSVEDSLTIVWIEIKCKKCGKIKKFSLKGGLQYV